MLLLYTWMDWFLNADESASLSGTVAERRVGSVITLPVSPGDIVNMEVYAAYEDGTNGDNSTIDLALLTSAVASTFGSTIGSTEQAQIVQDAIGDIIAAAAGAGGSQEPDVPKAYIHYILFDENFVPLPVEEGGFGYLRVSSAALMTGSNKHEQLKFDPLTIAKEGFIYLCIFSQ